MQNIMDVDEIFDFLTQRGDALTGCSSNELSRIEDFFQIELPEKYITFLQLMGKNAGDFLKGSDAFYKTLFDLKEWAKELLEENAFKPLPENAFVFYMHQGYQFAFFILKESGNEDDPEVYYYYEGKNIEDFTKVGSFTKFLTDHLGFL